MTDTAQNTVDDTQINTDSQEDFDAEFYGTKPKQTPVEDNNDSDDDNSETEEENLSEEQSDDPNIDADDDGTAENDDDDSSATEQGDDEPEVEEKPKGKKSVQERINELTAARREAEREAERLREELAKSRDSQTPRKEDETKETETATEASAPNPDDKEKYPLGDLDPAYQQDMLDYKLDARLKELDAKREKELQETAERQRTEALQAEWLAKLEEAETTYENYRETVETLDDAFEGIDPEYGQFLAQTVMSMDKGPDILYHLAQHPDEANAIIKSNPVNAALALGRLEARFATVVEQEKKAPAKRTTKAPTPPASTNKGNAPRFSVKPDTDDLDAFSDVFYKD